MHTNLLERQQRKGGEIKYERLEKKRPPAGKYAAADENRPVKLAVKLLILQAAEAESFWRFG